MKFCKILFSVFLLWTAAVFAAQPHVSVTPHTRYDDQSELFEVLLEFDIANGWHIFAPYEQTLGSPLKIEPKLPETAQITEQSFSRPKRFDLDDFSYDGYENKAFYKISLRNADKNPVKFRLSWQVCADECAQEKTELVLLPKTTPDFETRLNDSAAFFSSSDDEQNGLNFIAVLAMAFLGGIILNLMPCIFPILSIKIFSLTHMRQKTRRTEAVFYSLGVIVSMLAVAGILAVIRLFDPTASWGFQLQSPFFIGGMLAMFIILSLLMLDILNLNNSWLGRFAFLKLKNRRSNAFMTGLLAVLIASPCSAPFMGAAIGYALMMPLYVYFPVFFVLGAGYALPFALLTLYPKIIGRFLPRPGKWMHTLKKILSLPLVLTCLWLGWILLSQLGVITSGKNLKWHPYTPEKVSEALAVRQPVFIDFTAKWCLTCLMNKQTALQSTKLAHLVKEHNILLLRGDMTSYDAVTAAGLKQYGRSSVPLYIYYDGKSDDYLILPQILTTGILEEYLQ